MALDMQKIADALENLVNLDIRTVVGNYDDRDGTLNPMSNARVIHTRINLLAGDITTAMHDDFLSAPLDDIRRFHAQREQQAHAIIQSNIQAIKELAGLVSTVSRQQQGETTDVDANTLT